MEAERLERSSDEESSSPEEAAGHFTEFSQGRKYTLKNITADQEGPKRKIIIEENTEKRRGKTTKIKHTVYVVKCEPHFENVISVARRYNHFVWLRTNLMKQFPGVFVPPVPKKLAPNKNWSRSLMEERRIDLERFLNRLEESSILRQNKALLLFLTCPESLFKKKRKKWEKEMVIADGAMLKDLFINVYNSYSGTYTDTKLDEYINEFTVWRSNLEHVFKKASTLFQTLRKLAENMAKLSSSFSELVDCEPNLPRRDLPHRPKGSRDAFLGWENYHETEKETYRKLILRSLRWEMQDANVIKHLTRDLKELRAKAQSALEKVEKNPSEAGTEIEENLRSLADVNNCLVFHECEKVWMDLVSDHKERMNQFFKSTVSELPLDIAGETVVETLEEASDI